MQLSHLDADGKARMVDVSGKDKTDRKAIAEGFIYMEKETVEAIINNKLPKGDVFTVAKVAAIQAAKKTFELIPMCHNLSLGGIDINFELRDSAVRIEASVKANDKTGVEMEALTAVSVAALTIYDMAKAIDKRMVIDGIKLLEKSGGKSGDFKR